MSEDNQMKDINQVLEQYKGVPFLHNGRIGVVMIDRNRFKCFTGWV